MRFLPQKRTTDLPPPGGNLLPSPHLVSARHGRRALSRAVASQPARLDIDLVDHTAMTPKELRKKAAHLDRTADSIAAKLADDPGLARDDRYFYDLAMRNAKAGLEEAAQVLRRAPSQRKARGRASESTRPSRGRQCAS